MKNIHQRGVAGLHGPLERSTTMAPAIPESGMDGNLQPRAVLACLWALTTACDTPPPTSAAERPIAEPTEAPAAAPPAASGPKSGPTQPDAAPSTPSQTVSWTTIAANDEAHTAVQTAAAGAKGVPIVYVGATWCGPCKVYKASLSDPRMVQAHRPVHIIELDADQHASTLQKLSISPSGVPHWEMVDPSGHSVGKHIDGSAWADNTVENMAPALSAFFTGA